jgi:hypothetical protein
MFVCKRPVGEELAWEEFAVQSPPADALSGLRIALPLHDKKEDTRRGAGSRGGFGPPC